MLRGGPTQIFTHWWNLGFTPLNDINIQSFNPILFYFRLPLKLKIICILSKVVLPGDLSIDIP